MKSDAWWVSGVNPKDGECVDLVSHDLLRTFNDAGTAFSRLDGPGVCVLGDT